MNESAYAATFEDFYTFNNDAPQRPFFFDVAPVLERIPVSLETFHSWAMQQDWTTIDTDVVGSTTR